VSTFEPLTPERRRAQTRRHLLDAAALVFARKGFHAATIDEVARTAGFTKGAVYSNFDSKEDLFFALVDDRIERQFSIVSEVLATGAHDRTSQLPLMRDLFRSGAVFADDDWEMLHLEFVLYAKRNPAAAEKLAARAAHEREFVARLIEEEHANFGLTPAFPVDQLAELSLALFGGLSVHRLIDPRSVTEETLDTVFDFLYDAMGFPDSSEA
jgi:AcrR family transcriptional regulator